MLLLSSARAVRAMACLQSFFFQKEFFCELLNSFPAPQFGFDHLFESSLKRLDKPSLRFKEKHNCKVKKYSHVDTNAYWSELALQ